MARYDPDRHHRRSIRLKGHDYRQAGAYFVTICTRNRECLFGEVVNDAMVLNEAGRIVAECLEAIPDHFSMVDVDAFVIMPNHVHGIIILTGDAVPVDTTSGSPLRGPRRGSLGAVIGQVKSASATRINRLRGFSGVPVWQRNYFERIIRDDRELDRVRAYVEENPARWADDAENPHRPVP